MQMQGLWQVTTNSTSIPTHAIQSDTDKLTVELVELRELVSKYELVISLQEIAIFNLISQEEYKNLKAMLMSTNIADIELAIEIINQKTKLL
jgi:hypothetical protein